MRVVVAMSGGVDSSVAALLLRDAGHEVVGAYLRNGVESERGGRGHGCCGASDASDAQEVAATLGIPFFALDHAGSFGRIVEDFVAAWARGETPNPCVQCNRELKFGELLDVARRLGAQRLATGHYAHVERSGDGVELRRAHDRAKDQSYVLAAVPGAALRDALFPLGGLRKDEVRERARRAGLPVHAKPESQEICFVPTGDYRDLLRERRPGLLRPGVVRARDGTPLGMHDGAAGFTVGQRKGLRLPGAEPRFVLATDPARAEVVVGSREELLQRQARLRDVNVLASAAELAPGRPLLLQVRAHQRPVAARIAAEAAGDALDVALEAPGCELTPGQLAVLYAGERVVAAGALARG